MVCDPIKALPISAALSLLLLCGCGGGKRVDAPRFDANQAATKALEAYDTNKDGSIDSDELKSCASLKTADADQDGKITQEEITDRVRKYIEGRVGEMTVPVTVIYKGRPLVEADVEFIPEVFMSDMIEPAVGRTNAQGLAMPAGEMSGSMTEGFYRVKVSKQTGSGKETIPKRYNEETTLGLEIDGASQEISLGLKLELK